MAGVPAGAQSAPADMTRRPVGWPRAALTERFRVLFAAPGTIVYVQRLRWRQYRWHDRLYAARGAEGRHKGYIRGFFAAPGSRQQGIGQAFLSGLLGAARAVVEHVLLSIRFGNAGAIGLYRRLGFKADGAGPRALKPPSGYVDEMLGGFVFGPPALGVLLPAVA